MGKKVKCLPEGVLARMIRDLTVAALDREGAATYDRAYIAFHGAGADIMQDPARRISGYMGRTFKFYGEDSLGLVADVLFTLERVTVTDASMVVLHGALFFNDICIMGGRIVASLTGGRVSCGGQGGVPSCDLEVDRRSAQLWNDLLAASGVIRT